MSKIRFDVYTWIQKLPTSVYTFNGRSAQGGTETLLKIIPVNDNIRPQNRNNKKITFSINKWVLSFIVGAVSVISIIFVALLIFFFKHS